MSGEQKWHAPAKINLALHVTGQKADGYHLLDSIACFCEAGDVLNLHEIDKSSHGLVLHIDGPFHHALSAGYDNLISKAYQLVNERSPVALPAMTITLTKNLPIASGIGGGSADAAAMLNLLEANGFLTTKEKSHLALELGADVPMCLDYAPKRVGGIGEFLKPLASIPVFHLVLVNAGTSISTPKIFSMLEKKDSQIIDGADDPQFSSIEEICNFLNHTRNDLQAPAQKISPEIGQIIHALEHSHDCLFSRMSGSGGTCFGIFSTRNSAKNAASTLQLAHPQWWVQYTSTYASNHSEPGNCE